MGKRHKWFSLAASQGFDDSLLWHRGFKEISEIATRAFLELLEKKMPIEDVSKAQKQADEWIPALGRSVDQ